MSKTKFLSAVNHIIHDLEIMIDKRVLTRDRKEAFGIRVFTKDCPICERRDKKCPADCMLSTDSKCLDHKTFPVGMQQMSLERLELRLEFWREVRRVGQCLTEEAFDDLPLVREIIIGVDESVYRRYSV